MAFEEKTMIARILRALPHRSASLRVRPGDDAAVIRGAGDCVVSCDAFLDDVHFLSRIHPADSVGYKSLARATSDLAAMGVPLSAPRFFLMTLALPREKCGRWLDAFLRGMRRCARELRITLAGGDVSQQKKVAISITVFAFVGGGALVKRSGARPGDALFVTGNLGAAQLGLEAMLQRAGAKQERERHLYPRIRFEFAAWLAERRLVTAMIDTSDGLSSDLRNLCQASGAGARVFRDALPLAGSRNEPNAIRAALHGGEDYELLFTVPARLLKKIPARWKGVRITRIGEITRGRKIELIHANGRREELLPRGWDPFRRR